MDAVTENLLRELETSPTDLKKLVISTLWRNCVSIAVQADAVARWERDTRVAGRRFKTGFSARESRSRC
jgi:hypothetical protein